MASSRSLSSVPHDRLPPLSPCETSDEALMVAEALGDVISHLRSSLDHRSLFSSGFNRKLVKRIECLDKVRDDFMEYSRALLQVEKEVVNEEIRSGAAGGAAVFPARGAARSRSGGW